MLACRLTPLFFYFSFPVSLMAQTIPLTAASRIEPGTYAFELVRRVDGEWHVASIQYSQKRTLMYPSPEFVWATDDRGECRTLEDVKVYFGDTEYALPVVFEHIGTCPVTIFQIVHIDPDYAVLRRLLDSLVSRHRRLDLWAVPCTNGLFLPTIAWADDVPRHAIRDWLGQPAAAY